MTVQRQAAKLDALLLRIRELEAQLKESEQHAASAKARLRPAIIYEKEQVGYAFSSDQMLPLQACRTSDSCAKN